MRPLPPHQYINRESGRVVTESLFLDRLVCRLYGTAREKAPALFKALISGRSSRLLSYLNFDCSRKQNKTAALKLMAVMGIELRECVKPEHCLQSTRSLFERQIKYWNCRPIPQDPASVVSPADAKMLVGSFCETDQLFLKEKFFTYKELLGPSKNQWRDAFKNGDFAVLRLTPEKYHYNHTPVSGRVVDFYCLEGDYHSCNPGAVISEVTPFSKNKRVITIFDTDIAGGTNVGLVAMVEIVALMIGEIVQCYSSHRYDAPKPMELGMMVDRGQPKSLYRPGSSVDVLFFQKNRVEFDKDLIENRFRFDVVSRYSLGFGKPLVETDVRVRSSIARRREASRKKSRTLPNLKL
ncbi:MAG: phosphatidylserine decarboxylase [Desulfobacterales bacterium]|nr:phosphatidylserine decarboxylase [Desulfobacterales bacterium]